MVKEAHVEEILKKIAIWIWCFPQQLLGGILRWLLLAKKRNGYYLVKTRSFSMGEFIFLNKSDEGSNRIFQHERGHVQQSYILGWLFLLVIGIPEFIWFTFFGKFRKNKGIDYYSFFTEKWADKLGGVENFLKEELDNEL